MPHNPLHRLLEIDRAIRPASSDTRAQVTRQPERVEHPPDGLASLIQRAPDTEAWLSWIVRTARAQTCGALDELLTDCELDPASQTAAADHSDRVPSLHLVLLDPNAQPVPPSSADDRTARFSIGVIGQYKLSTLDRTVLWSQDLTDQWGTAPPETWRLAAAPPPPSPEPPEDPSAPPHPLPELAPEDMEGADGRPATAGSGDEDSDTNARPNSDPETTDDHASHARTLFQQSQLPDWGLTVEFHRSGTDRWLDVINLRKESR